MDNLNRLLGLKDKDLSLSHRETNGLKEDNERLSKMYQLVQNEAFNNIDKLKKNNPNPILSGDKSTDKKVGYQPSKEN